MKKLILSTLLLLSSLNLFAQLEAKYLDQNAIEPQWVQLMYAESPDAGLITEAYQAYYKTHPFVKNKHTQYYKRWQRSISRGKALPTQKYIDASTEIAKSSTTWESRGPFDFDIDAASRSYAPGAAHIYCVEQANTNSNRIYAGTATAGLWRSDDKGENWFCLSKALPVSSVYALEIDPTNANIIYFSGAGTLYKSTDGGNTHTDIGAGEFSSGIAIKEIMYHNGKLWVASDQGLYYSTNNGTSFTQKMSGTWLETEVHPTNNQVIYAVKQNSSTTSFYKSTNNGASFTAVGNGWPSPDAGDEQKRTEIAVSPAAPNKIVALATGAANGGSGLYGVYISDDQGANWEFKCCGAQPGGAATSSNINMMGWSDAGTDDGGQYYYDLALAVNPLNANIIHVAGVQHWISTDGGDNFSCPAKWSHPDKDEYIHADIHDMRYFGNDLWVACDGGVFYSNNAGDTFDKKMYGISGTDFWGFGAGFSDGEVMLGGTYHNGTLIKDNEVYEGGWLCAEGGDNYRGFVNFADSRKIYTDGGGRILSGDRTQGLGSFAMQYKPNASYIIGESSNLEFDPRSPNILYIGNETTLYKSIDNGASTTVLNDFGEKVTSVEVAWSNPDVIYVATYPGWWSEKHIWKTTNAGATWTNITPSSATINAQAWIPYDITISSDNANHIWIARTSMYGTPGDGQGYDVFKSLNGGASWINWTTATLNNENITNIEHQRGSNGGVYLGTRQAVYYRDNSMSDWVLYNNNLPLQTASTQLIPYYKEGKLKNGTNQGVWEVDFYTTSPPSAQISADRFDIDCTNNIVQFYNHSAMRTAGEIFEWSFPGGTPSTSIEENPLIYYQISGTFDVTLTVTDINGTDSQTITDFINFDSSALSDVDAMMSEFEDAFPPENWSLPESSFSWQNYSMDNGPNCEPSTAAYVNHYYINQSGAEASLMSPQIDLSVFNQPVLSYDYAYTMYGGSYSDGLRIEVSNDCGAIWNTLYEAYGSNLETVPSQSSWWEPADCSEWADNALGLSEYADQTIHVRFVAVNGYGNSFFLDNVNFVDNDGSITVSNPIPGCTDVLALNYNPGANIDDGSCNYQQFGTQNINLEQGWNIFSTYIQPSNTDLANILVPIEGQTLIVKDYQGLALLPAWGFNGIGDLDNSQGYQIKVEEAVTLSIDGELISPENHPININQGWNIISYLREAEANIEAVFTDISTDIIIIKNYAGLVYLPEWGFNGIGNLKAGEGYQLKASSETTLQYLSNDSEYRFAENDTIDNRTSHIEFSLNTGSNMHVLIPEIAWKVKPAIGDEIYAYDAEGNMIAASKITLPNTVLCLWGDDQITEQKEALFVGEDWTLKLWKSGTNDWIVLQIEAENSTTYQTNQFVVAEEITANSEEVQVQLFDAVPNPAKNQTIIRIYLNEENKVQLSLFDIVGNKIQEITNQNFSQGYHEFEIDLNSLSSGTYLYQMNTKDVRKSKRIEIIK